MRIFRIASFRKFSESEGVTEDVLRATIREIEAGLIHADLGGGLFKQRVRRPGGGKSGGFRVLVGFRKGDRAFFLYGYAKNERTNVTRAELLAYRQFAALLLSLSESDIETGLEIGEFDEVENPE
ncbi:MAG: type II toxin-antitoxin system RelE/ParE family toxin [Armatimonadetes bacterium]|nr:type II toxin-antitoxin system RelE/ParE family toxin [Armatimonadota bacterium]